MDKNVPLAVDCAGCGRRSDTTGYQLAPGENVPKEQITRQYNPGPGDVLCALYLRPLNGIFAVHERQTSRSLERLDAARGAYLASVCPQSASLYAPIRIIL